MTIDEAIEGLSDLLTDGPYWPPEKRIEAVKLGIEALKRIKEQRIGWSPIDYYLLPGETQE